MNVDFALKRLNRSNHLCTLGFEAHSILQFELLAKKYKKPVLIVHGDADNVVPLADSERVVKMYKNARLHVIPGAGHGFDNDQFAKMIGWLNEFLSE